MQGLIQDVYCRWHHCYPSPVCILQPCVHRRAMRCTAYECAPVRCALAVLYANTLGGQWGGATKASWRGATALPRWTVEASAGAGLQHLSWPQPGQCQGCHPCASAAVAGAGVRPARWCSLRVTGGLGSCWLGWWGPRAGASPQGCCWSGRRKQGHPPPPWQRQCS